MKAIKHLFLIIVALAPLIYIAIIWKTIPAIIPTHFNTSMQPDDYGGKSSLLFMSGILAGVSLLVYFLVRNIDKIDPKRAGKPTLRNYNIIATVVLIFIAVLNMLITSFSVGSSNPASFKQKLLIPLIGLFFAIMGLLMRNVKPNYFIGIRIPWTLHSDYNWKKTHLMAGYLWFVCGLLVILLSLCFPASSSAVILQVFVGIIVIIPIAYSFILFKKEQAHPEIAEQEKEKDN